MIRPLVVMTGVEDDFPGPVVGFRVLSAGANAQATFDSAVGSQVDVMWLDTSSYGARSMRAPPGRPWRKVRFKAGAAAPLVLELALEEEDWETIANPPAFLPPSTVNIGAMPNVVVSNLSYGATLIQSWKGLSGASGYENGTHYFESDGTINTIGAPTNVIGYRSLLFAMRWNGFSGAGPTATFGLGLGFRLLAGTFISAPTPTQVFTGAGSYNVFYNCADNGQFVPVASAQGALSFSFMAPWILPSYVVGGGAAGWTPPEAYLYGWKG